MRKTMSDGGKAVFLDKDGTLVVDVPYNVDPEKMILCDDCVNGLKSLQDAGYLLMVVTNQAGVARGLFGEGALKGVEQQLKIMLGAHGIKLSGFYYCPHHPRGVVEELAVACDCRKPQPGMLIKAATEHHIDLQLSWMIGDILNDIEAGNRAGCKSILIDNGNETEWLTGEYREPEAKIKSINEAAHHILMHHGKQLAAM
jgi:D-glycero-D-manno-heptose 1,7-bisphosphate phosphatase